MAALFILYPKVSISDIYQSKHRRLLRFRTGIGGCGTGVLWERVSDVLARDSQIFLRNSETDSENPESKLSFPSPSLQFHGFRLGVVIPGEQLKFYGMR